MTGSRPEQAEATGVFFLVFAGGAAILADLATGMLGLVGIATAFGLVILALVYALGHVSGAHFNPAITLAFAATGHFPWRRVPSYVAGQLVGATAAAFLLHLLFGDIVQTTTRIAPAFAPWKAFVVEMLATALLAFVIIGVATDRRAAPGAAGLAIGTTVGLGALFAGPFTGGSMNPARSIGPALVSGALADLWIYLAAPVTGALLGMFLYEHLRPARLRIETKAPIGALGPFDPTRAEADEA